MKESAAGCVLADRAHAAQLVQAVADFGEEWLHWAELFAAHEGVDFILLFFDSASKHPFHAPFAIFISRATGLPHALEVAMQQMPSVKTRWALMVDEPVRNDVNSILAACGEDVSAPYRLYEPRKLH